MPEQVEPPKVVVDSGALAGAWVSAPEKTKVAAFLGVPYAKPPVGELRWCPPESPDSWGGVRQATKFGAGCLQADGSGNTRSPVKDLGIKRPKPQPADDSEDCLYLNVYSESLDADARRPVMVWIHGGGFNFGRGSHCDPQHLVRKGIVVVTINYRLGVLGFMAHPELSVESPNRTSGNYGLLDQIESLRWIKRNIAGFGGNPDNVTIFGESAGGMAVSLLMISPLAGGLFHRGIAQSGVGLQYHRYLREDGFLQDSGESCGSVFAKSVRASDIGALREMDADSLVKASTAFNQMWAFPYIDGYVIPEHPIQCFRKGRVHPVPFMLGSNGDEGGINYPFMQSPMYEVTGPIDTIEKYRDGLERVFESDAKQALALYPANSTDEMVASSITFLGDSLFGAQAHYVAVQLARVGKSPYLYFLTRKPAGEFGEIMGAHHAMDISYVFGTDGFGPKTDDDRVMSALMMNYWVQFARTGDPNNDAGPHWSLFDEQQNQYMEFGEVAAMTQVSRMDRYHLMAGLYDRF